MYPPKLSPSPVLRPGPISAAIRIDAVWLGGRTATPARAVLALSLTPPPYPGWGLCWTGLSLTPPPLTPPSAVVGELDEDLDSNIDYSMVRANPLKSVGH